MGPPSGPMEWLPLGHERIACLRDRPHGIGSGFVVLFLPPKRPGCRRDGPRCVERPTIGNGRLASPFGPRERTHRRAATGTRAGVGRFAHGRCRDCPSPGENREPGQRPRTNEERVQGIGPGSRSIGHPTDERTIQRGQQNPNGLGISTFPGEVGPLCRTGEPNPPPRPARAHFAQNRGAEIGRTKREIEPRGGVAHQGPPRRRENARQLGRNDFGADAGKIRPDQRIGIRSTAQRHHRRRKAVPAGRPAAPARGQAADH